MSDLAIGAIKVIDRHRSDLGDLSTLVESIRENGLLHPIVITAENRLVAGQRRLEACRQLGFEEVPVRVVTNLTSAVSLLRAERDENTCRKEMTPLERKSLTDALLELERPAARVRQASHGAAPGRAANTPDPSAISVSGVASDIAAEAAGWSRASYNRTTRVLDAATDPTAPEEVREVAAEALADVEAGRLAVHAADQKVAAAKERHTPRRQTNQAAKKREPRPEHLKGTRRIDPNRIFQTIANDAANLGSARELFDYDAIDLARIPGWVSSLEESIRFLRTLKARLNKELTRAQS